MSIASTDSLEYRPPALAKSIVTRFLWKEYRMLRGFWLAVAMLGVLMQLFVTQLMFDTKEIPVFMLLIAWGSAALYAVGAAVTLFSAESEENTRGFLLNLPGRWLPMYIGKVTLAIVSAFCLGLVLCMTSGLVNSGTWAYAPQFRGAFAVGGVAVLEATAWGLLFSLWMRQPLLAAVLAIGAMSFSAQVAIAVTTSGNSLMSIESYREAVPVRIMLSLAVFAIDVVLGVRWFQTVPHSTSRQKTIRAGQGTTIAEAAATIAATTPVGRAPGRRRMMTRLLWQSCRESWKTMLAAVPIALFLMASLAIPLGWFHLAAHYADLPTPLLTLLFLPALFGALVFRADQKGDRRQFLVAHAARPRYVWLSRHLLWGIGWLTIACTVSTIVLLVFALGMHEMITQVLAGYGGGLFGGISINDPLNAPRALASHWEQMVAYAIHILFSCWTSIFTAYAVGQFCSLMLRREILAGLLALLAALGLAAWTLLITAWQLSTWWFVFPIGLGAMAATWLRMPAWVVANNRPRTWALPLTAIIAPCVLVGVMLPSTRLQQLQGYTTSHPFTAQVEHFEATQAAGRKTADEYFQLFTMPTEVTADTDLQVDVDKLLELTKRPECRFTEMQSERFHLLKVAPLLIDEAKQLEDEGNLEAALERHLAWRRFNSQLLQGQPIKTAIHTAFHHDTFGVSLHTYADEALLRWAKHPDQTSELLRKAITELELCPQIIGDPVGNILADHQSIRAVVQGDESPRFFHHDQWPWSSYLAFLANQLPWERQRALQALDLRIEQISDHIHTGLNDNGTHDPDYQRSLLSQSVWNQTPMPHYATYTMGNTYGQAIKSARVASTSYLVSQELNERLEVRDLLSVTMRTRTQRCALLTQLALLAYQLDHQRYPETLAELLPYYLPALPRDPLSDGPLQYRSQGFDLPILKSYPSSPMSASYFATATIPAYNPLLWSVGIGNKQPQLDNLIILVPEQHGLQLPDKEEHVEVIYLEPARNSHDWLDSMIFSLPPTESPINSSEDDHPRSAIPSEANTE